MLGEEVQSKMLDIRKEMEGEEKGQSTGPDISQNKDFTGVTIAEVHFTHVWKCHNEICYLVLLIKTNKNNFKASVSLYAIFWNYHKNLKWDTHLIAIIYLAINRG